MVEKNVMIIKLSSQQQFCVLFPQRGMLDLQKGVIKLVQLLSSSRPRGVQQGVVSRGTYWCPTDPNLVLRFSCSALPTQESALEKLSPKLHCARRAGSQEGRKDALGFSPISFTILLLFQVLVFWPGGMWDLSSPTRVSNRHPLHHQGSPSHFFLSKK